ncbi:MAG: hypothetical protein AAGD32_03040 [Planctomycetota bacterium]
MQTEKVQSALDALEQLPEEGAEPALDTLGRLPIGKTKFPVLGFMATVYEEMVKTDEQRAEDNE